MLASVVEGCNKNPASKYLHARLEKPPPYTSFCILHLHIYPGGCSGLLCKLQPHGVSSYQWTCLRCRSVNRSLPYTSVLLLRDILLYAHIFLLSCTVLQDMTCESALNLVPGNVICEGILLRVVPELAHLIFEHSLQ